MSKIRVYELAKQIGVSSKDLIQKMSEVGIIVKNHMSTIDDTDKVLALYKKNTTEKNKPVEKKNITHNNNKKIPDKKNVAQNIVQKNDKKSPEKKNLTQNNNNNNNKVFDKKNTVPKKTEQVKTPEKKQKSKKINDKKKNVHKNETVEKKIDIVKIPNEIMLNDLANKLDKPVAQLIKILMLDGLMVNQNQVIDFDLASKIAEKFNINIQQAAEIDLFEDEIFSPDDEEDLLERPPVVVVMGHVDHGKTSLLDTIRHTNVMHTEAGGITQHIGAYTVSISGKPITFLDTPGHEAFTAMRMRGAQATDIAILVVAADDGIMPQTIEAINHAKAAGVEIIVAINKIDKPGANIDAVKQELIGHDLVAEDWGGKTVCVPVSAKNNIGIDDLLEMIVLVAEMKELKANPNKSASGIIIESKLDRGRGPIATVLVQGGTLKVGDPIVAGSSYGKIRAMIDDKGNRLKKAGPSTPVEILGLSSVPNAGDTFYVTENEKRARQLAESVANKNKSAVIKNNSAKISLEDLFGQIKTGNVKELGLIIKADVQGSVEAMKNSLERLSNDEVKIKIVHGGVGAVTESDIMLASASNAIVIGFNVRPELTTKSVIDSEKVDVRLYRVIYDAIEDVKLAMQGMLEPVYEEKIIGHAQIRQLFKVSSLGTIGGAYVTDGKITRNSKIRVVRDGKTIYEGELETLKRFKDNVKEVAQGYECGIMLSNFNDIKENDVVEAYVMEEISQSR